MQLGHVIKTKLILVDVKRPLLLQTRRDKNSVDHSLGCLPSLPEKGSVGGGGGPPQVRKVKGTLVAPLGVVMVRWNVPVGTVDGGKPITKIWANKWPAKSMPVALGGRKIGASVVTVAPFSPEPSRIKASFLIG